MTHSVNRQNVYIHFVPFGMFMSIFLFSFKLQSLGNQINLFVIIEGISDCHVTIVNTFMDAIMENINAMVSNSLKTFNSD